MEADFNNATLDGALDVAIFAALIGKRHIVPARVVSFDVDAQTIVAEPMISLEGVDGNPKHISPVVDVPILQLGGGNYVITFKPSAGDGCLLLVSDRCIDDWYETGEKRVPGDFRQNDISDSLAIVGFRTKPTALKNILDGCTIRTVDGSNYININNGTITHKASVKVYVDAPLLETKTDVLVGRNLHVKGGTTFDGNVSGSNATATFKDATIAGITYSGHKHKENGDGGGITDGPQ